MPSIKASTSGCWCSEASCHSSGCKSRQQRSPVAVVVIPSNGEGDRSVGSLEVKALGGRAYRSDDDCRAAHLRETDCADRGSASKWERSIEPSLEETAQA